MFENLPMLETLLNNPAYGYIVFSALCFIPVCRIFIRTGFSPIWGALIFVPYLGLFIISALLALRTWPAQQKTNESS